MGFTYTWSDERSGGLRIARSEVVLCTTNNSRFTALAFSETATLAAIFQILGLCETMSDEVIRQLLLFQGGSLKYEENSCTRP